MITIWVNDEQKKVDQNITIQDLLEQLHSPLNGIAVAINNEIIPQDSWKSHLLNELDRVLIIQATQGG